MAADAAGQAIARTYLNLGCGSHFHPDWINIDIAPQSPLVHAHDLSRGIPLPDASCDVVYHSHMLEHLRRDEVLPFLRECRRVLKPDGIIRIATPDLARIGQLYLEKLGDALAGGGASSSDYEWIALEMFDQAVREQSGGEMLRFLQTAASRSQFVHSRIGKQYDQAEPIRHEVFNVPAQTLSNKVRRLARTPLRAVRAFRRWILRLLLGPKDSRALEIGRFRLSGEVHHWLYDRFSLSALLTQAGFVGPKVESATSSRILNWSCFALDASPDGAAIKPDSFYMEAIKPVGQRPAMQS